MATKTVKQAETKDKAPSPVSRRLAWLSEAAAVAGKAAEGARADATVAVADPSFGLDGWRSDVISRLVEANAADRTWKGFFRFWEGGCGFTENPGTLARIEAALEWADEQATDAARCVLPNSTSGAHNLMRAHETHATLAVLNDRLKSVLKHARRFLLDGSCYDDLAPDGNGGRDEAVSLSESRHTLGRRVLTVNDPTYPQYTGRYILTDEQASDVETILAGDEPLDAVRGWLDEHGNDLIDVEKAKG